MPKALPTLALCSRCNKPLGAFLTLAEAATCLNVPPATMERRAHRERAFPLYHVGRPGHRGFVRVLHADFEILIQVPAE